jgi:hypothetical protein
MPTQPSPHPRPEVERDLLAELAARWGRRAVVKKDELDLDGHYDPELPDFPGHLVPPLELPGAQSLDDEARRRLLAAAWISYNAKTAAVENRIVLPACRLMLQPRIPVRHDEAVSAALQQTIIDEHYHILMCDNAVGVTRRRRGLQELAFDPGGWAVIRGLEEYLSGVTGPARDLAQIGFALAAETTISGYLSALARAEDIQPMNRITTDLHRRDENGHAVIFRELACSLYLGLGHAERELFRNALATGLAAFYAADFDPWVLVAAAGGFEIEAGQLAELAAAKPVPARDTGALQALLRDLGISEASVMRPVG